ncbi:hypothetical protein [Rhodanobacter ginsengiterrae]|uniref:hypothetical protein n=1 Tax=Rhodanobacter ginsengiterrae TaxID=2008451 RepID=UPI003CEDAEF7
MAGKLVISFDCEGKWGIADRGNERHKKITSLALYDAYKSILEVLEKHNAKATFAFVAALCLPADELRKVVSNLLDIVIYKNGRWLEPAENALRRGDNEGWSEPGLIDLVRAQASHHLCSHGGFHVPYDEDAVALEAIIADIQVIRSVDKIARVKQDLIVFPRNQVGFNRVLADAGFLAYRPMDLQERRQGPSAKAIRVVCEFIALDRSDLLKQKSNEIGGLVALSAGKFLNARIGIRNIVPTRMTKLRIDSLLNYAVDTDSTLHFYSHPHNFIDDADMVKKLDYLLERAAWHRTRGCLDILTMKDELDAKATVQ